MVKAHASWVKVVRKFNCGYRVKLQSQGYTERLRQKNRSSMHVHCAGARHARPNYRGKNSTSTSSLLCSLVNFILEPQGLHDFFGHRMT